MSILCQSRVRVRVRSCALAVLPVQHNFVCLPRISLSTYTYLVSLVFSLFHLSRFVFHFHQFTVLRLVFCVFVFSIIVSVIIAHSVASIFQQIFQQRESSYFWLATGPSFRCVISATCCVCITSSIIFIHFRTCNSRYHRLSDDLSSNRTCD